MTDDVEIKQLRFRFRAAADAEAFAAKMRDGSYDRTPIVTADPTYVALGVKAALADEVTAIAARYNGKPIVLLQPKPLWP